MDYRGLAPDFEPFKIGLSGNQKKVWSEKLKNQLKEYIYDEIVPRFRRCASEVGATIDVDENGEKLFVSYTREAGSKTEYLREQVLLEFGGRNITEPNEEFHVNPDIAAQYKHIDFPTARPTVLSPERTFWEKRTMNR